MIEYGSLNHSGTPQLYDFDPHGSGRYRQGSGENPDQHVAKSSIREQVKWLKSKGMSMDDIATGMKFANQNELRKKIALESEQKKVEKYSGVYSLYDSGITSCTEIGKKVGLPESTVRGIIAKRNKVVTDKTQRIANVIKDKVSDGSFLDVGEGSEIYFNQAPGLKDILKISDTRLNNALEILKNEGYTVATIKVQQATNPNQKTSVKLVGLPGTTTYDMQQNKDKIKTIVDYTIDGYSGETRLGIQYPKSLDSKRLQIVYPDEGGGDKDGVIELRPGVEDISLGGKQYAQVRIAVDGTHYLKGMAIYADDLPEGIDVRFNTGKGRDKAVKGQILKELKKDSDGNYDKDNPFGAAIKVKGGEIVGQRTYIDENGERQLSLINKVNDEGDWGNWGKSVSSQFLSKQSMPMIKNQLDLTYKEKKAEFDDIMKLSLPEVKKQLLLEFADECDSSAVDLKAAPFAGQSVKVILPDTKIKEGQCYAPSYPNGTKLALIRYPHAGTFEIPTVTVNNNDVHSRRIFKDMQDAIGITPLTARQLSGADFDGDSVTCIPLSDKVRVNTRPYFEDLKKFAGDFHEIYAAYDGMTPVKKDKGFDKTMQMGLASNLITDMTLRGAPEEDILKAVKHSMVVIDAEKHNLDWRRSMQENDIPKLRKQWQGKANGGASTLISKSSGEFDVPERKFFIPDKNIDPETGAKVFDYTGRTYVKPVVDKKTGTTKLSDPMIALQKSTKMYEALNKYSDARVLSSGLPQEEAYAFHANRLYSLANEARKAYLTTGSTQKDEEASKKYAVEVASLKAKLLESKKNAPKERYANVMAQATLMAKMAENPNVTRKTDEGRAAVKKISTQALAASRFRYGAHRQVVKITDDEWEAITHHALGSKTLSDVIKHADKDRLRELATPRESKNALPSSKVSWLKSLKNLGYTTAQIAERTGISTSTISKYTSD